MNEEHERALREIARVVEESFMALAGSEDEEERAKGIEWLINIGKAAAREITGEDVKMHITIERAGRIAIKFEYAKKI